MMWFGLESIVMIISGQVRELDASTLAVRGTVPTSVATTEIGRAAA